MGIELVKDRAAKTPFDKAGEIGLPEGVLQGVGLDSRRAHLADEPAYRDGRRYAAKRIGHHRRGDWGDRRRTSVFIAAESPATTENSKADR